MLQFCPGNRTHALSSWLSTGGDMRNTRIWLPQFAPRQSVVVAAFLGLFLASCKPTNRSNESGAVQDSSKATYVERAPGLPKGCKANAPPSTPAELRACLDSLAFDSIEAVGDEQPLMINPGHPTYGPLAKIEPEIHSHLYDEYKELKEGRIIAKLFLRPHQKEDYPKLGLVRGDTTYWWVQITSEDTANAGRSVYLTLSGKRVIPKEDTLRYTEHPEGSFKQAVARWIWDPKDETTQGSCGHGCCH
jgi:hypothetical protein